MRVHFRPNGETDGTITSFGPWSLVRCPLFVDETESVTSQSADEQLSPPQNGRTKRQLPRDFSRI